MNARSTWFATWWGGSEHSRSSLRARAYSPANVLCNPYNGESASQRAARGRLGMARDGCVEGVGLDLVVTDTIRRAIQRDDDAVHGWLTESEHRAWETGGASMTTLAGRIAAKEAVVKALGTGFNDTVAWQDVEIFASPSGGPEVRLSGGALAAATRIGVSRVLVSITHVDALAAATAIAVH